MEFKIFFTKFCKIHQPQEKIMMYKIISNQESDNNTDKLENISRLWQSASYVTCTFVKV